MLRPSQSEPYDRDFVVGWVAPIGVELESSLPNTSSPISVVRDFFGADTPQITIKMVELIEKLLANNKPFQDFDSPDYFLKTRARQQAGNHVRADTGIDSILADHCVVEISEFRKLHPNCLRVVQIRSLKHPEEARLLRRLYGESFFLIGVHESYSNRKSSITIKCDDSQDKAQDLINHDAFESDESGQNTRDLFELCDAFISLSHSPDGVKTWQKDVERALRLCTSYLNEVPGQDEFGMQIAYNASFRSGDLARQVGAALFDTKGRMISVGRNDAPKAGGGLYQVGQPFDVSDYALRYDPGERFRSDLANQATKRIINALKENEAIIKSGINVDAELHQGVHSAVVASPVKDIIEFGRSVHAEMDALLSAAAQGISTVGGTLYTTTFPCHTCARHLIAAGIMRIVYVQPYPKSHAIKLHGDSLLSDYLDIPQLRDADNKPLDGPTPKVRIEPLIGISPR